MSTFSNDAFKKKKLILGDFVMVVMKDFPRYSLQFARSVVNFTPVNTSKSNNLNRSQI